MSATKATLLTLLVVALTWLLWRGFDTGSASVSPTPARPLKEITALQQRIDALEQTLLEQQSGARTLEQRVQALEQRQRVSDASTNPAAPKQPDAQRNQPELPRKVLKRPPTLAQKLTAAGLPDDTVQRIRERIGQNRLALLNLRNRAIREGWIDTPQYFEQSQALSNPAAGVREQEGDAVYDQYLYAAGRANRVLVTEVYAGSAAEQAGIESGDMILSYAQQRIFSLHDLQQATTEGKDGEMVLLELQRDGQTLSTSVPRGPLGIAMTAMRQKPLP